MLEQRISIWTWITYTLAFGFIIGLFIMELNFIGLGLKWFHSLFPQVLFSFMK